MKFSIPTTYQETTMKALKIGLIVLLTLTLGLTGCATSEDEEDPTTTTPTEEEKTLSEKIVDELEAKLKTSAGISSSMTRSLKATNLTTEQISQITDDALQAVSDANPSDSDDLIAVMPAIVAGIASTSDVKAAIAAVTSGAVEGLDDISTAGYDADSLDDMVKEITTGATGASCALLIDGSVSCWGANT